MDRHQEHWLKPPEWSKKGTKKDKGETYYGFAFNFIKKRDYSVMKEIIGVN
jgi:hypothetical protein